MSYLHSIFLSKQNLTIDKFHTWWVNRYSRDQTMCTQIIERSFFHNMSSLRTNWSSEKMSDSWLVVGGGNPILSVQYCISFTYTTIFCALSWKTVLFVKTVTLDVICGMDMHSYTVVGLTLKVTFISHRYFFFLTFWHLFACLAGPALLFQRAVLKPSI